jgi:hypothetical protein
LLIGQTLDFFDQGMTKSADEFFSSGVYYKLVILHSLQLFDLLALSFNT